MFALNSNVVDTGTPPIPAARAWMAAYDGAAGPPIDLSQAAPGSPPPPALLERLAAAAGRPDIARYGAILGDAPLREAYAGEVSRLYGADAGPDDIAVTAGCNLAFLAAALAVAGPGASVILPAPWYFNHQMTLQMLGIGVTPLACRPEDGFVPNPTAAEALIDATTRAIVLVTPNNPTGAIYPEGVIAAFEALCRRRGLALIIDETYRDFLSNGTNRAHGLLAAPGWRGTVVQLYSFSKAYAVPGHRIGAITAGPQAMGQILKVLDSFQICAARPAQDALAWGITGVAEWRAETRATINRRIAAFETVVNACEGWQISSIGAYFAYVRHPFAGVAAERVAEALARQRGVLGLPGSFFGPGQEGHLRFAFANADEAAIATLPGRLGGLAP
ncbi:aspartate/tyrosine/aromatic aminotransferase [Phreatobacter cathodiphilus]|uniref:Aminotransferase n=1 Tax=Phreatobacter cathodiphilus TaxID=1868589 RepID=A0A2S0N993_9HYPH|nr:aspartate/tyrosine/aromatic aminotransferase [Phreatobacter cathodiphilus]